MHPCYAIIAALCAVLVGCAPKHLQPESPHHTRPQWSEWWAKRQELAISSQSESIAKSAAASEAGLGAHQYSIHDVSPELTEARVAEAIASFDRDRARIDEVWRRDIEIPVRGEFETREEYDVRLARFDPERIYHFELPEISRGAAWRCDYEIDERRMRVSIQATGSLRMLDATTAQYCSISDVYLTTGDRYTLQLQNIREFAAYNDILRTTGRRWEDRIEILVPMNVAQAKASKYHLGVSIGVSFVNRPRVEQPRAGIDPGLRGRVREMARLSQSEVKNLYADVVLHHLVVFDRSSGERIPLASYVYVDPTMKD